MSCILRITGEGLSLNELLSLMKNPEATFRKGEVKGNKVFKNTSANYLVSDADFDRFDLQKRDAIFYLKRNHKLLIKTMSLPGIESACLDFAIEKKNTFTQSNYLEPELLKLAGNLGVAIEITQYPCSESDE